MIESTIKRARLINGSDSKGTKGTGVEIVLQKLKMKSIKLRKHLYLDKPFAFLKWLPDGLGNALEVNINDINIKTCVHLEYGATSTFKIKSEEVSRSNHSIETFILYLTVPVLDETDINLYGMSPPRDLCSRIAIALNQYLSTLYGIVRNDIGQYWIQNSHEIESLDQDEILNNIQVMNPEGDWVQFCVGKLGLMSIIHGADYYINQERWLHFKELIERNHRCDLSLVFFRNAQSHFHDGNLRLAIVEVCIALERAIAIFMPQFICDEQRKKYEPILEGDSLTEKARQLLPLLKDNQLITDMTVETCVGAIDMRNQVIHRSRVNLVDVDIRNALNSIKAVLDKLNPRLFDQLS